MVEIYRHQFKDLSALIARLKLRSHRFIIYMDDLSFEDFETDYKFLKAVIEGGCGDQAGKTSSSMPPATAAT